MTTTLNEVEAAFKGREPNCGGYDSKFKFNDHYGGIVVQLEAQWAARYCTPSAFVTAVDGENITFQFLKHGQPDGIVRKNTVSGLAKWLADQASEG